MKKAKSREVLSVEFLDCLQTIAEEKYHGRLYEAFVDWYIMAEYGKVKWHFTDNNGDGGIDAIIELPNDRPGVIILQSKFSEKFGKMPLGVTAYKNFNSVVDAFYYGVDEFEELLNKVRDDAKPIYKNAYHALSTSGNWQTQKRAFRLITTCNPRPRSVGKHVTKDSYHYFDDILRLYGQFRLGAAPSARPLELSVDSKLTYTDAKTDQKAYLINAKLSDFSKYLESNLVSRLVARNIRYSLGGPIAKQVKKTYEEKPNDFWYFHNGITIVCDRMDESEGIATLLRPSVINGAQTLYMVKAASRHSPHAHVTTRIIVRGVEDSKNHSDDKWLQAVIRGVNTQNRVLAADFWCNEPEQFELQGRLRDLDVFYERKRGEWKEVRNEPRFRKFETVTLTQLGQIQTVVSDDDGHGVLLVKKGRDDVFDSVNYKKLYPSRKKVAKRFPEIYFSYRLWKYLNEHGYRNNDARDAQKHGFWNCLWLSHRGISKARGFTKNITLESIRRNFDNYENSRRDAPFVRKYVRELTKRSWEAWKKKNRQNPDKYTPNNFFKSPYGNEILLKSVFPKLAGKLADIGTLLTAQ